LRSVALSARLSLGTNEFGASKGFALFDLPLLEVVGNGTTRCLKGGNVVPPAAAAFRFVCQSGRAKRFSSQPGLSHFGRDEQQSKPTKNLAQRARGSRETLLFCCLFLYSFYYLIHFIN
jgi:hypothetical protein